MKTFTEFKEAQRAGTWTPPAVSFNGKAVDFFAYQFAVNKGHLKLLARGLKGQIPLRYFKQYYGITGRTAADLLPKLEALQSAYEEEQKA